MRKQSPSPGIYIQPHTVEPFLWLDIVGYSDPEPDYPQSQTEGAVMLGGGAY